MKIFVIGDTHLGYDFGGPRGEDSFLALEEAIERGQDADLILMLGDVFDTRIPKPEIFARAARILGQAQNFGPSKAKLIGLDRKEEKEISPSALRGIPIVAISGTHDRRSRHLVNPVQALEHAGLLINLHCATAVFQIGEEKIAIHGLSGVPERYAKDVLQSWNPVPVKDAKNIFLMHQSIEPYIYSPLEPPSLKLEDLPIGMNLYLLGHMHWRDQRNFRGGQLVLTGSTIFTSIHKTEAEQQRKGFWISDGNLAEFVSLKNSRKVLWHEMYYTENTKAEIESALFSIPQTDGGLLPIINIKIKGKLPAGASAPNFSDLEQKYSGKGIIRINKNLEAEDFQEQIELLHALREARLSPEEQGLKLLAENLKQANCGIKAEEIFDLLVDGNSDLIFNVLSGKQKTLGEQI